MNRSLPDHEKTERAAVSMLNCRTDIMFNIRTLVGIMKQELGLLGYNATTIQEMIKETLEEIKLKIDSRME